MMPLSEDEQRILQEIEAHLFASDPQLVQQVAETTLYRHAARSIKWATLGFVGGLALLVVSFASSLVLGFVGFLAMLACAFVIERNVRKLGKAGLESLTSSMRFAGLREGLGRRRGRFERGGGRRRRARRRPRAAQAWGRAKKPTTNQWARAPAITKAWKISWYPKTAGAGSGRFEP